MSSSNAFKPPTKNGVGPSTVGIPANTSLCAIEFLASKEGVSDFLFVLPEIMIICFIMLDQIKLKILGLDF
jgi:hypothetical protein